MIQFFKDYFWKQVKKYGLKVVIIGIIGKIISMTTVFVGIPYWFWNSKLLPKTKPRTEILLHLHPDSSNKSHLALIENTVSEAGGYGGQKRCSLRVSHESPIFIELSEADIVPEKNVKIFLQTLFI